MSFSAVLADPMPLLAVTALASAFIALALPASSFAHAGTKSYSPKPGSTVARDLSTVRRDMGRLGAKHRTIRARPKRSLEAGRYKATAYWLNADGHVQIKSWFFHLR